MRSFHWQYLGFVLVGVGSGLSISGLIAFIYFQQHPLVISPYRGITPLLLTAGVCIMALGIVTFRRAREKRRQEGEALQMYLPPPPPPPPPPP